MRLKRELSEMSLQELVKTLSVGKWKKMADIYFSRYIRLRGYNKKNEAVQCITCGKWFDIKEVQAGHFVSRSEHNTRFDEENVYPQCQGCNVFKHGNYAKYSEFLINNFGENRILELNKRADKLAKFTAIDYAEMVLKYWQETNKLLLKNKLTQWWKTTQKEEKLLTTLQSQVQNLK